MRPLRIVTSRWVSCLLAATAVGAGGCVEDSVDTSGVLTVDGKPLVVDRPPGVLVTLTPVEGGREAGADRAISAKVTPRGEFQLHGVRPGVYHATVSDFPGTRKRRELRERYGSGSKGIDVEVSGGDPITLSIDSPSK